MFVAMSNSTLRSQDWGSFQDFNIAFLEVSNKHFLLAIVIKISNSHIHDNGTTVKDLVSFILEFCGITYWLEQPSFLITMPSNQDMCTSRPLPIRIENEWITWGTYTIEEILPRTSKSCCNIVSLEFTVHKVIWYGVSPDAIVFCCIFIIVEK